VRESKERTVVAAGRWWQGLWGIGCVFLALLLVSTGVGLDLRLSSVFYDPDASPKWFLKTTVPWIWLYKYGEVPTWGLAVVAALVWLGSLRWRPWVRYRAACALIVLAVTLGPGVLVNGVIKPLWGRPRPQQADVFGGARVYRHWWQAGSIGGGRSLPSGHASMGYILVVGTCLVPGRWRVVLLSGALVYGSLLGATRIIQGGHFLSDVLWSGALMCFLAALLQAQYRASWGYLRPPEALDTMDPRTA